MSSDFGRSFGVPEFCVSYRLLQTVLFFDRFYFSCVAYFDESMASKIVYKP